MAQINFKRVDTMPTSGMTAGTIYFDYVKGQIGVSSSPTQMEMYSSEVRDVTYSSTGVLTVTKANGTSFALDFSDVASSTDVSKAVGGLLTTVQNLASSITNKADRATTLAGYGITNAYTKTELDNKLAGALHYKSTYDTFAELNSSVTNPEIGDTYNIRQAGGVDAHDISIKAGDNVAWNGTGWDDLGGTTDLSNYVEQATFTPVQSTVSNLSTWKSSSTFVNSVRVSHEESSASGVPKGMISVTPTTATDGTVVINIDETALDNKLKEMADATSGIAASGVTMFGGQTGQITVNDTTGDAWDVVFSMNGKLLTATVTHDSKLDHYTGAGGAATENAAARPIYIANNGTPTELTVDTVASSSSYNLVTSKAAKDAAGIAETNAVTAVRNLTSLDNLTTMSWETWPAS